MGREVELDERQLLNVDVAGRGVVVVHGGAGAAVEAGRDQLAVVHGLLARLPVGHC